MLQKAKPAIELKDQSLFRQQCYVDGAWVDGECWASMPDLAIQRERIMGICPYQFRVIICAA